MRWAPVAVALDEHRYHRDSTVWVGQTLGGEFTREGQTNAAALVRSRGEKGVITLLIFRGCRRIRRISRCGGELIIDPLGPVLPIAVRVPAVPLGQSRRAPALVGALYPSE
jgi:hypothetical protein